MKTSITSKSPRLSRVFASHEQPNLTNASFRWHPDLNAPTTAVGRVGVTLLAHGTDFSITAMLVTTANNGLSAVFTYHSPNRAEISERMPVSRNEPVHLELDIDPSTSNVAFWINDKGLDMGVLPGFKGGADSARWHSGVNPNRDKLSGVITDCAVSNANGWKSTVFRDEHLNTDRLHDSHTFDISSPNSIVLGGSRSLA